jgi:hypothetical protein
LSDPINIFRIILGIIFVTYEFWAFKNNKSISHKLSPLIFIVILGILIMVSVPFVGSMGFFLIFAILMIELSFIGVILVVLLEIWLSLFSTNQNLKRILILTIVFIILVGVYYLGQRIF